MQGFEETVNLTNLGLEKYVKESRKRLLTATKSVGIDLIELTRETTIEAKKKKEEKRAIFREKKTLHGQFVRQTKKVGNLDRWKWLRNGTLKRETENLICAAQEQAIRTNLIKGKIDKSQEQTK